MTHIKHFITTVLLLFSLNIFSSTLYSTANGNWEDSNSWSYTKDGPSCSCTPQEGDSIIITSLYTVTITSQVDFTSGSPTHIEVHGELHFQSGKKLKLDCSSIIMVEMGGTVTGGGGGGNSNLIEICDVVEWKSGDGDFNGPGNFPTVLPISLIDLDVRMNDNRADINWSTSFEMDNDFFTIERSQDGVNFEVVAKIKGAGNSNEFLEYSATDKIPYSNISYYRLKQTDYNGDYSYSTIVSLLNEEEENFMFKLFPNPISKDKNLYLTVEGVKPDKEVLVVVYDVLGNLLYSKVIFVNIANETVVAIDPHKNLPCGTYIIIGTSDEKVYKKKLIIKE